MERTCSTCDNEATASLQQEPLCQTHAQERLDELKEKQEVAEKEVEALKAEYERVCNKYDVNSYGEIDHQLNVENREDIDEGDVQIVNDAEAELASKQHELDYIAKQVNNLKKSMDR
jgi:chromosome segregation ATPase